MTDPNIPDDFNESLLASAIGRGQWKADGPQLGQLMMPLNPARVANRVQGKTKLSYVEAWDIKRMLIRIFGFANFSADVIEAKVLKMVEEVRGVMNWENGKPSGPKMVNGVQETKVYYTILAQCTVRLTIHATGATYTESAAASQTGPDIGEVTDFAIKTAESDALKRAAIYLGSQFGLSLYDDGSLADVVNTVLEPGQKNTIIEFRQKQQGQQKDQKAAIAKGAPVQGEASAPAPSDDQPMALYDQADPNAGDGLKAPNGGAKSAVAGAFSRGRGAPAAAGPSVNSVAGAEYYSGESFGDNA